VGGPDSSAPIKLGVSDRIQVLAVLGRPGGSPPLTGDPFGPVNEITTSDYLAIWFGRDGKVQRYELWTNGDGRDHPRPVPRTWGGVESGVTAARYSPRP
jgi:hypothetical protein